MPAQAQGFFKVFRKIFGNEFLNDGPFDNFHAWVWLLSEANYETVQRSFRGQQVTLERGQLVSSYASMAETWGWGRNRVIRFLDKLEAEKMIKRIGRSYGVIVEIVKYEEYQGRYAFGYGDGYGSGYGSGYGETVENTGVEQNQRYANGYANGYGNGYAGGTHYKNIKNNKKPSRKREEGEATKKWNEIKRKEAEKNDGGRR